MTRSREPGTAYEAASDERPTDELTIAQTALARERERYRTLYDLAPVALLTTDGSGKVTHANSTAAEYLQIEQRFLVGKPIWSYVAQEERSSLRRWTIDLQRRRASGVTTARLTRRSGVTFDADVRLTPFEAELWWAIIDLTARRQAETSLWELNREIDLRVALQSHALQAIYDELPVGIAIVDAVTREVHGKNRRAREILGPWGALLPGLEVPAPPAVVDRNDPDLWQVDRALAGESVSNAVTRLPAAGGRELALDVTAGPIRAADGRIVAAVICFDDVSARTERDLADAAFVENAAHQLRTPITAIAIAAAALTAGAKDEVEERERFIGHITRESNRMARVIDALLGLARIQRGGGGLLLAIVPLGPMLEEIVGETPLRSGVRAVIDCPRGLAVVGDAAILREAIANVVANAASHTEAGTIRITAHRDAETVRVEIVDSGPGVAAGVRDRIFDRFFQGSDGARRGAGLGLAIAAEGARANDGALELVDTNEGAIFRFTLPAAKLL